MGLRPTQADEKRLLLLQLPSLESAPLPFVISTEASSDFLLRAASDVHVYGSP